MMTRRSQLFAPVLLILLLGSSSFPQVVPPPQVKSDGPPLFVVTVNGKDGFMDREGKIVIEPSFEKAFPFTEGLAGIQQRGMWGFIDTEGHMVIEPKFASVGLFSDGMASFQDQRLGNVFGYIDKSGEVVIKPQFDCAEEFRNGIARVGFTTFESKLLSVVADVGTQCEYRFIDRKGNFVTEPSPTHYAIGEPDELIHFTKNGRVGYLNAMGEVAIEPQFQAGSNFSEGLAYVNKDGLFGYIDTSGKWAIEPRFEYATDFSEGLAGVPLEGRRWGFIDRAGNVVIAAKFAWVLTGFRHGVAEVAFDRKRGYINTKGEWVWQPSE
jgi:WG containing repeat